MLKKIVTKQSEEQSVSLGRRFGSYLIDWYIGALCTSLPISLASQKLYGTMLNQNLFKFPEKIGILTAVLALICAFFYFVIVPTYIYPGQTLGKKWCQLKIVRIDQQPLGLKALFLRQVIGMFLIEGVLITASSIGWQLVQLLTGVNLVHIMMYIGIVISVISSLLVAFNKKHQAIHDYIGQTKVIKVSRETLAK